MKWTKNFKMGNSIIKKQVINSGSIFGSSKEITLFISQMIFMLKFLNMTYNIDQGSLIYFYYSHPSFTYPVNLQKQGYGYTLAFTGLKCDIFLLITATINYLLMIVK